MVIVCGQFSNFNIADKAVSPEGVIDRNVESAPREFSRVERGCDGLLIISLLGYYLCYFCLI